MAAVDALAGACCPSPTSCGTPTSCALPARAAAQLPAAGGAPRRWPPAAERCAVVSGLSRRRAAVARAALERAPGRRVVAFALAVAVPAAGERNPRPSHGDGASGRAGPRRHRAPPRPPKTTAARAAEAMAEVDLVHFNCHGMFLAPPLEAALMMSDGLEGPRAPADLLDPGAPATVRPTPTCIRAACARTLPALCACSSGVTNEGSATRSRGSTRADPRRRRQRLPVSRWKIDVLSSQELVRAMYRAWLAARASARRSRCSRHSCRFSATRSTSTTSTSVPLGAVHLRRRLVVAGRGHR